ncbi:hypothetical protein [Enterovibrio paralichthyis]|nr:hypothetical protein [Enterovibrio paralichthyis]MBV7297716.1 hypothetical protein [Enterovibrio paralichthyis]
MTKPEEKCHVCDGKGVTKPEVKTQKEWEAEGYPFQPIECQHCGGSGVEP